MERQLTNQKPLVVWFSGLSGSGKTTLSEALQVRLLELGFQVYILDGDKIRNGLCKDLGFSEADRKENIRRVGEVAKLMMDAGVIVLSAFITPFEEDREIVKRLIGPENLIRVFVDCPLEVCESRDVKGLYKKARTGEIKQFTGISSPFEKPSESELTLKTAEYPVDTLVEQLLQVVLAKAKSPLPH